MDKIGVVNLKTLELFGLNISFNPNTLIMTWVVILLLTFAAFLCTRKLKIIPGKTQSIFELIYEFLTDITESTLGKKDGQKYLPLIATIFIFVLASNWIGIFPNILKFLGSMIAIVMNLLGSDSVTIVVNSFSNIKMTVDPNTWYSFLFNVIDFEEPTRSVNTDLALGILVFFVVHHYGIKNKGIMSYLGDYMDPVPAKLPYTLFFFLNPFIYLNLIGAISNVVSHSFRLFGNMFGGYMIIAIVSTLIYHIAIPVGLLGFFGLFSGLVQAFVFTMLAVTYIGQQR